MPPFLFSILAVLILFSAIFSAAETSLIALNKIRLRHLMESKKRGAKRVYKFVQNMDKIIATVLVGNNMVNTAIAAIATLLATHYFGEGQGLVIGALATSVFLIIFCELTPKIIATNHPEGVSFLLRHLMSFFLNVFRPVTYLMTMASRGLIRLFGGNPHSRSPLVTEEEIKMMIQIGKEQGFYGDHERKMLERIFHFDEIELHEVMTPIEQMVSVPLDVDTEGLENVLLEEGHNRIPVYQDHRENIIGILYVRDLLYLIKDNSLIRLEDLLSAPYFVEPKQKGSELLKEFLRRKIQIAIVRDPLTQKALGLVTLEDLIEEIVGEIEEIDSSVKKD